MPAARILLHRLLPLLVCVTGAAAATPAVATAQVTLGNWDSAQQRLVVKAGLMSDLSPGGFGGAQRLRGAQANRALAGAGRDGQPQPRGLG